MLKYSDLKDQQYEKLDDEIRILVVNDIIQDTNTAGETRFVMTHQIEGTNRQLNFDTYKILDKDGNPLSFGTAKLKKLLDACNVEIEEIDVKILKAILPKRRFKAMVVTNDNGYLQIRYSDIYALDPEEALHKADAPDTTKEPREVKVKQEKVDVEDL
jgi:ribosomal protein L12E/L44/L45/RPP1/RPP2